MLELKATDHHYYCNDSNYYKNGVQCIYSDWQEFKDEWEPEKLDIDYNHIFRFDIKQAEDDEGNPIDRHELYLYFMLQRKGSFVPVWIKKITQEDMAEIDAFLKMYWEYMKHQWKEFREEPTHK